MKHLLLSMLALLLAALAAAADATPNLALVCYSGSTAAALPVANCPTPAWHTPGAGEPVETLAGTWIPFSAAGTVAIKLCNASLSPGNAPALCPATSVSYELPCHAAGAICPVAPPTPPASIGAAVLTWTASTSLVGGGPLPGPVTYNVYRGAAPSSWAVIGSTAALTYTDPATSSTPATYAYGVSATCSGCTESAITGPVTATIALGLPTVVAPKTLTVQ